MNENHGLEDVICAVDGDADAYRLLFACLDDNLTTVMATSGREALRLAAARSPTLWLINLKLPDMSGVDLIDMLRQLIACSTVCLVGDQYSADDERTAHRTGTHAYLCKPLEPSWVLQLLRRIPEQRSRASPGRWPLVAVTHGRHDARPVNPRCQGAGN